MARIVPFTEARAHLTDLLDEVQRVHEHVVITRNGRPSAVVMSHDEYEILLETLEVLGDDGALSDLRESEEDVEAGRVFDWDDVKRDLQLG